MMRCWRSEAAVAVPQVRCQRAWRTCMCGADDARMRRKRARSCGACADRTSPGEVTSPWKPQSQTLARWGWALTISTSEPRVRA